MIQWHCLVNRGIVENLSYSKEFLFGKLAEKSEEEQEHCGVLPIAVDHPVKIGDRV